MDLNQTFLLQALSFAILIAFTMKFIWPPLISAIEERQKRIADGLAAADRSQRELAQAEDKIAELLKDARVKANEIIDQAHVRANQIVDKAKEDAIAEAWLSGRGLLPIMEPLMRKPLFPRLLGRLGEIKSCLVQERGVQDPQVS